MALFRIAYPVSPGLTHTLYVPSHVATVWVDLL